MTQHKDYLLVEMEEGEVFEKLPNGTFSLPMRVYGLLELSGFDYTIIGLASEIGEEEKEEIVDRLYLGENLFGYENYGFGLPKYDTPSASFASLLASLSMKEENCLIIKKN